MSAFPALKHLPGPYSLISTYGHVGPAAWIGGGADVASAVWVANVIVYIPVVIPASFRIEQLVARNGVAVSGNIDMGIYDEKGTRIVSAGSTAQAGASADQTFNVTDTLIGPGQYYLALSL